MAEIRFAEIDNRLNVAIMGDLDNTSVAEVERMMAPVFNRDDVDLVLNCERLNYISSRGLRLLITLYKHQRDNGMKAFITKMNENVREALDIGGFLQLYQEI